MSTTNQIAGAICKALGMPARFAAEKEPVSPTLSASVGSYLSGLSDEALNALCHNSKAPKETRKAAVAEWNARRRLDLRAF